MLDWVMYKNNSQLNMNFFGKSDQDLFKYAGNERKLHGWIFWTFTKTAYIHVRALHVQIMTCLVIVSEASSLHGHDLCLRLFIYLGCINLAWCICLACSELSPIPSINEFNDSLDKISVDTNVGRLYSLKPTFEESTILKFVYCVVKCRACL